MKTLYVSPALGNDSWPGTLAKPNADGTLRSRRGFTIQAAIHNVGDAPFNPGERK